MMTKRKLKKVTVLLARIGWYVLEVASIEDFLNQEISFACYKEKCINYVYCNYLGKEILMDTLRLKKSELMK